MPVLAPPAARIDDGTVGLRAFQQLDLAAFEAAALPGGNDGVWLILYGDDPRRSLAAHIGGWSAGEGRAGPALAVVLAGDDTLAGVVYFTVPERGQRGAGIRGGAGVPGAGVATRAARLAAGWLLRGGGWQRVELRIGDGALASQRVAVNAGFRPAGRVSTWVPSAGRAFDDRLYLMERPAATLATPAAWDGG